MTTTEKMTLPATPAEGTYASINELRMTLYRLGLISAWRKAREKDEADFFGVQLGLDSKESYIAFRDQLKSLINVMAAGQVPLRQETRQRGGSSSAQESKAACANAITLLIEIRRAGKVWSAAEVEKSRQE